MIRHLISDSRPYSTSILTVLVFFWITAVFSNQTIAATNTDRFHALYVPPHKITQRTFDEIVHYADLTPVNAVVLHVKTPRGKLLWPSDHSTS